MQSTFRPPEETSANGLCSDANGDVFVTAYKGYESEYGLSGYIFEYAHGGTTPIATLSDSSYEPLSCAIDPTTGNLAVTNLYYNSSSQVEGNVAVYSNAQGTPTYYSDPNIVYYSCATYDQEGDLFVFSNAGFKERYIIELPSGDTTFEAISVNGELKDPLQIQWDGTYLAVLTGPQLHGKGSHPSITRLSISGSIATIAGHTTFKDLEPAAGGAFWVGGNRVVLKDGQIPKRNAGDVLGIFRYPHGGKPENTINTGDNDDFNFSVSLAPTR